MATTFGLSTGSLTATGRIAATDAYSNSASGNNTQSSGPTSNLPLPYSYTMLNNPSNSGPGSQSSSDYHTDRSEWMNRIESSHIDRNLMNALVMNYLVTEGFKEAAEKFSSETGICYPYDDKLLDERINIREFIENGNIDGAISFINKLHPQLIDKNRILAFHLQQQELIELIREKKLEAALIFAQNRLCEYCQNNEPVQEELERTMALLAFENPDDSPFCDLLHKVQRQRLASEVNSAILESENLEPHTKLSRLIKTLLWTQDSLDKRSINFPRMIDLANAKVEEINATSS